MTKMEELKVAFAECQLSLESLQAQANQLNQKKQEIVGEIIQEQQKPEPVDLEEKNETAPTE